MLLSQELSDTRNLRMTNGTITINMMMSEAVIGFYFSVSYQEQRIMQHRVIAKLGGSLISPRPQRKGGNQFHDKNIGCGKEECGQFICYDGPRWCDFLDVVGGRPCCSLFVVNEKSRGRKSVFVAFLRRMLLTGNLRCGIYSSAVFFRPVATTRTRKTVSHQFRH